MNNQQFHEKFSELSTPLIADACLRLKIPLRVAPSGIHPLSMENHIAGQARSVRHYGSVDIFLEAMGTAQQGDILVIDNQGRMDEGCIGDLTALEAQACGLAGMHCCLGLPPRHCGASSDWFSCFQLWDISSRSAAPR